MPNIASKLTKEERAKILGLDELLGGASGQYTTLDNLTDGEKDQTSHTFKMVQPLAMILAAFGPKIGCPMDAMQSMMAAIGMLHSRLVPALGKDLPAEHLEAAAAELAEVYRVNMIANMRAQVFDE